MVQMLGGDFWSPHPAGTSAQQISAALHPLPCTPHPAAAQLLDYSVMGDGVAEELGWSSHWREC